MLYCVARRQVQMAPQLQAQKTYIMDKSTNVCLPHQVAPLKFNKCMKKRFAFIFSLTEMCEKQAGRV